MIRCSILKECHDYAGGKLCVHIIYICIYVCAGRRPTPVNGISLSYAVDLVVVLLVCGGVGVGVGAWVWWGGVENPRGWPHCVPGAWCRLSARICVYPHTHSPAHDVCTSINSSCADGQMYC